MRISDWGSDVCSSDLLRPRLFGRREELRGGHRPEGVGREVAPGAVVPVDILEAAEAVVRRRDAEQRLHAAVPFAGQVVEAHVAGDQRLLQAVAQRSEEHTSELQSLMRISYAVFCLKKKTYNKFKRYNLSNINQYNTHRQ